MHDQWPYHTLDMTLITSLLLRCPCWNINLIMYSYNTAPTQNPSYHPWTGHDTTSKGKIRSCRCHLSTDHLHHITAASGPDDSCLFPFQRFWWKSNTTISSTGECLHAYMMRGSSISTSQGDHWQLVPHWGPIFSVVQNACIYTSTCFQSPPNCHRSRRWDMCSQGDSLHKATVPSNHLFKSIASLFLKRLVHKNNWIISMACICHNQWARTVGQKASHHSSGCRVFQKSTSKLVD